MLSVFFFFFFCFLDSPKLVRRRRGRLEDLVFLGDSRFFFVCRFSVLLVFCFDFGSAFVVFPQEN